MAESEGQAWRCNVCGYIHRGPAPPELCPICGAAAEEFEIYEETPSEPSATAGEWRCLNCNYVHEGGEPPEKCPVCGAARDRFEAAAGRDEPAVEGGEALHIVVVGGGIAGVSAVESITQVSPSARVTLLTRESRLPYYRLNLTRLLAGEVDEDSLPVHPESWYSERNIEIRTGAEVAGMSPEEKEVTLRDGDAIEYDRLILATGAHPFIPPIPGAEREGVTSLRTVEDALEVLAACKEGARCVCIGGGILGIETAGALARRGADVTLLEGHGWLMPRQLNRRAGEIFQSHVEGLGIHLRTESRTESIVGDERAAGVSLSDGGSLPAELVVIATGVRPNSHLARRAGLEVHHGVVVGNRLAASLPNIFAAGDVAEHRGTLYGTWSPAQYQGSIAGLNAVGREAEFGGIPRSNTLKVLGLDLWSIGQFEPDDGSYRVFEYEPDGRYFRFVFRDGVLVGSILLGDTTISSGVKKKIEEGVDCSGLLNSHPTGSDIVAHFSER
jgi:nitrite reductase (NADH) large subunit